MMDAYFFVCAFWEFILYITIIVIILFIAVGAIVVSRRRVKEINELSEAVDMIWDLWYRQLEREAEAKYKVYTTRGFADRLPDKRSAIQEDRELQQRLLKANSKKQRKSLLKEYLPEIMFPLVICKLEGISDLNQKDAFKLKQLMNDYGVRFISDESK